MYGGKKDEDMNALFKEGASGIVVEFVTIVTLNKLHTTIEMSKHKAMKVAESGEGFRFQFEGKSP
jgi:hypothetical protein